MSQDPALLAQLVVRAQHFAQLPSSEALTSGQAMSEQTSRWDEWTTQWRETEMSRILDNVSARFATPVSRPELESPLRTNTSTAPAPTVPAPVPVASTSQAQSMSRGVGMHPALATKRSASFDPTSQPSPQPFASSSLSMSGKPNNPATSMDFAYKLDAETPPPSATDLLGPGSGGFELMSSTMPWSGDQLNLALADLLGDPLSSSSASSAAALNANSQTFPHMLQPQSSSFDLASLPFVSQYPWAADTTANASSIATTADNMNNNTSSAAGVKQNTFLPASFISSPPLLAALNESSPASVAAGGRPSLGFGVERTGSPQADDDSIVPTETDTVRYQGSATGMHHQALESSYTGSFWYVQFTQLLWESIMSYTELLITQYRLSLFPRENQAKSTDV